MPELPEVETVRQQLAKDVVGRKVKEVAVTNGKSVRRHKTPKAFRDLLEGRTIKGVGRLGKYLILELDDGSSLVIHLRMSGQLLRAKSAKEEKPKHTHVVITFTQSGQLRFVDPRTFGEMFVSARPAEGVATAVSSSSSVAMGGEGEANHLKKGGKVKKYAEGGKVMQEKGVDRLPAKGSEPPPLRRPAAGEAGKIATMKKGGQTPKPMRKAAARGR